MNKVKQNEKYLIIGIIIDATIFNIGLKYSIEFEGII